MSTVVKEIVTALRKAGVDKMFGIPGGRPTADMVSACADAGIEFVLTQHETSAVRYQIPLGCTGHHSR